MSAKPVPYGGTSRVVMIIAIVLVVVAAGLAGWFGVAWYSSAADDDNAYSRTREEVRAIGSSLIVTLTTLDYQSADAGFDRWLAASTGDVRDQLVASREQNKNAITAARTRTTARVLDAAVTELNPQQHTATIIAAVEATVVQDQDGKSPTTVPKRMRLRAVLTDLDGGWKVEKIGQVDFEQPPAG